MSSPLYDTISEFLDVVQQINGVYLDATSGFRANRESIQNQRALLLDHLRLNDPRNANEKFVDQQLMLYSESTPESHNFFPLHQTTIGALHSRNSPGGQNFRFIGNLSVVALYGWWEDHYRGQICAYLKLKDKGMVRSAIMGDIGRIRNDIVHHRGLASEKQMKNEILKWFSKGDEICIDHDKFQLLIREVLSGMNQLYAPHACE